MADEREQIRAALSRQKQDLGPLDAELRQLFGSRLNGWDSSKPPFTHDTTRPTEVVGGPKLANDVETLFLIAPFLRGLVPRVVAGPTTGQVFDPEFDNRDVFDPASNGVYFPRTREIGIDPEIASGRVSYGLAGGRRYEGDSPWREAQRMPTLAHEFGHAVGYRHGYSKDERQLDNIEGVARMRAEFIRQALSKK